VDDIEAIKQLKARYFRTMDTKDWAGMRRVFTDDVVLDTTASGGSVVSGADACMEFLERTLAGTVTVHHGHMPEITLTSSTTATGIWALHDHILWSDGWGVADQILDADPAADGSHGTGAVLAPTSAELVDVLDAPLTPGEEDVVVALAGADHLEGQRRHEREVERTAAPRVRVLRRRSGMEGVAEVHGHVAGVGGERDDRMCRGLACTR
jgi:ketosteroid isomerase-like protein